MHLVAYSFSQCLMLTVYDWFHYSPIFPILQGKSIDFIEFSLILTLFLPVFPFPVPSARGTATLVPLCRGCPVERRGRS